MTAKCLTQDRPVESSTIAARRLRVMIVEDSRTIRELLTHVIAGDPRFEIAAAVESGEQAMRMLAKAAPDVITMDIRLPGMDGLETTRRIMAERPTPIVVVAADTGSTESKISIEALQAGALVVLEKPHAGTQADYQAFADRMCTQLAIMAGVKVITRRNKPPGVPNAAAPVVVQPLPRISAPCDMIGIVASTGGPQALLEIFKGLGPEFPIPILLVQHMTTSFIHAFTEWLDSVCPLRVTEATNLQRPLPGHIYTAPPDHHLLLRHGRMHIDNGPPVCMQRPSGSVLLSSMALSLGQRAVGVLLTGMGNDGASGLADIRCAGGHTIAEDASTAVVYGMPGAAVAMDAAVESLPLPMIPRRLRQLTVRDKEND